MCMYQNDDLSKFMLIMGLSCLEDSLKHRQVISYNRTAMDRRQKCVPFVFFCPPYTAFFGEN